MLRRLLSKKAFRRFGRSRSGSPAVELALVFFPFFLLTGGLAEVAMLGFAQASLDFAVSETARQIRTGQAQLSGASGPQIKQRLCTNMSSFMFVNCDMNVTLDIDRFNSYVDAGANPNRISGSPPTFNSGNERYVPGVASDIVVVRAYYRWDLVTPFFEQFLANAGRQRIIVSTMMFRNEPF